MKREEKSAFIQETITTKGWEIIDDWFNQAEENITREIKDNLIYLKAQEMGKWGAYYAGQAEVIKKFHSFIENILKEPPPKKKDILG